MGGCLHVTEDYNLKKLLQVYIYIYVPLPTSSMKQCGAQGDTN